MSRSGYSDDGENVAMWRGQVASAIRGRRGQLLLRDLIAALDAMPDKRLFQGHLVAPDGGMCALGVLGTSRGVDMSQFERYIDSDGCCDQPEALADDLGRSLNAAHQLIQEVQYMNDEWIGRVYDVPNPNTAPGQPRLLGRDSTPEERWARMRAWASKNLIEWEVATPTRPLPGIRGE